MHEFFVPQKVPWQKDSNIVKKIGNDLKSLVCSYDLIFNSLTRMIFIFLFKAPQYGDFYLKITKICFSHLCMHPDSLNYLISHETLKVLVLGMVLKL